MIELIKQQREKEFFKNTLELLSASVSSKLHNSVSIRREEIKRNGIAKPRQWPDGKHTRPVRAVFMQKISGKRNNCLFHCILKHHTDTADARRGTLSLGLRELLNYMTRKYHITPPGLIRNWGRVVIQYGGAWNQPYPASSAYLAGSWHVRGWGPIKPVVTQLTDCLKLETRAGHHRPLQEVTLQESEWNKWDLISYEPKVRLWTDSGLQYWCNIYTMH